jgi:hypothetical protein
LLNPTGEGAISLLSYQKTAENNDGLGEAGRAGQEQVVLIT